MSNQIVLDQELVDQYVRIKGVSEEEARKALEANMIKEASVDIRQQMTTLMNAFRKMSPQLMGVVQREGDYANGIAKLNKEFRILEDKFDELIKRLDFERETYKKAMNLLNGIVAHDEQTLARIAKLEASSVPLYKRVLDKIKCLLNN